jgi:opacity protein-like surface antigen
MLKRSLIAAAVMGLCLAPAPARADVLLTPFAGLTFGGITESTRGMFGFAASFTAGGIAGLDIDFGYSPEFFGDDDDDDLEDLFDSEANMITLMANLRLAVPIGGTEGPGVRPYVSGGIGLMRSRTDATDLFDEITSNDWGFNAGAGVNGFFNDNVGLQGEVRYFRAFDDFLEDSELDLGSLDFWRGSFGVTFRF